MKSINYNKGFGLLGLYICMNFHYILGLFNLDIIKFTLTLIISILFFLVFVKRLIYFDKIVFYMLAFLLIMFLSKFYSISTIYASEKLYSMIKVFIIFIIVRSVISSKDDNTKILFFFKFTTIVNILLVFLYILLNFNNIIIDITSGSRLGSESINSIWLGRLLCDICLCIIILIDLKTLKKLYYLFLVPFLILSIASGTKGALISLIFSLVIYFILKGMILNNIKNKLKILVKIAFFMLFCIVLLSIIDNLFAQDFLISRFSAESIFDSSRGSRLDRFYFTLELMNSSNLIMGNGLGSWAIFYSGSDLRIYPHNMILEIIAEMGLVGLILFAIILHYCIKNVFDVKINNIFISTLFIYYFVNSMFSGDLGMSNLSLFIYMAISTSSKKFKKGIRK